MYTCTHIKTVVDTPPPLDDGFLFIAPRRARCHALVTVTRTPTVKGSTGLVDAEQSTQPSVPNIPAYRSRSCGFGYLAHQCNPYCHFTIRSSGMDGTILHVTVEGTTYRLRAQQFSEIRLSSISAKFCVYDCESTLRYASGRDAASPLNSVLRTVAWP